MFCRLPLILAALAVCSSCSKPGLIYVEDDQSDMPRSIDFAGSTADLAGTMAMDMASARDLASGYSCRGEDAPGKTYKLVMNSLTLPGSTGSSTFAYDFDGDGRTENQLKNLVAAVSVAGLDLQGGVGGGYALLDALEDGGDVCIVEPGVTAQPGFGPRFDCQRVERFGSDDVVRLEDGDQLGLIAQIRQGGAGLGQEAALQDVAVRGGNGGFDAGHRAQQHAVGYFLDDEFDACLPVVGHPHRFRQDHLALGGEFRGFHDILVVRQ